MTEAPPRTPRRRPSPFPVAAGSVAAFLALFAFLAFELRAGRDPALGVEAGTNAAPVKRVVLKRIERRVVVTRLLPPTTAPAPSTTVSPGVAAAAPSTPRPAPAPAPSSPAPAPAPAPAPVVTRAS